MNLESPEAMPLPEPYIKALEAARNQVTLAEAETNRLTMLRRDQERELISLSGKLADATKEVAAVTTDLEAIKEKQTLAKAELDVLSNLLATTKAEKSALDSEIEASKAALVSVRGEHGEACSRLEAIRFAAVAKEAEIASREAALATKTAAIESHIKSLSSLV
jgi:chromosome segregation ATPase